MKQGLFLLALLATVAGCGRSSTTNVQPQEESQIIGGSFVEARDNAAARSLIHLKSMDRASTVRGCSGTLIAPDTVLTAAHCLDNKVAFDRVYVEFTLKPQTDKKPQVGVMTGYALHPLYNTKPYLTSEWVLKNNKWVSVPKWEPRKSYNHDIAILVFKGGLPAGYSPVEIDTDERRDYGGERITVYGYGMAGDHGEKWPKELVSRLYELRRGNFVVRGDFDRNSDAYNTVADEKTNTWTCQGDSGGPQFITERGVTKVIGVNSTSNGPVVRRIKNSNGTETPIMSCKGSGKAIRVAPFSYWIQRERQRLLSDRKTDPRQNR